MITKKKTAAKKKTKGKTRKKRARVGENPIIITGGSVTVELPDNTTENDHFPYDAGSSKPQIDRQYPHAQNASEGKLGVLRVEIVKIKDGTEVSLFDINLERLGISKSCKVKVHYGTIA